MEWYVLKYNFNKHKVEPFNIFSNKYVNSGAIEISKAYANQEIDFEEAVKRLSITIMSEEWGRREYEIGVGDTFESDISKLQKIDCYQQVLPNIKILTEYVLEKGCMCNGKI